MELKEVFEPIIKFIKGFQKKETENSKEKAKEKTDFDVKITLYLYLHIYTIFYNFLMSKGRKNET